MNSRLLNVPAILVAVLTVSIGMYVYNSSQTAIIDSMPNVSTQEIDAFNNQFTVYEGTQAGSNVKALMGRLVANADTYRDEVNKIPGVVVEQLNEDESISQITVDPIENEDELNNYIQMLAEIRSNLNTRQEYFVEMTYQDDGTIDYIHISYDSSNPITDLKYR